MNKPPRTYIPRPRSRYNQELANAANRLRHEPVFGGDLVLEPVGLDEVVRYCIPEAKIGESQW